MFTPTLTSLSGWITTTCASLGATGLPLLAPSCGDAAGSGGPDGSASLPVGTDDEMALICSPAWAEAAGLPSAPAMGPETGLEVVVVASITRVASTTADRLGMGCPWESSGQCGTLGARTLAGTTSLLRSSIDAGRYTTWTPVNFSADSNTTCEVLIGVDSPAVPAHCWLPITYASRVAVRFYKRKS